MDGKARTQYARSGNIHIADQVVGDGDMDLLLIDTWAHHVEAVWDFPDVARFLRRLSSFGRLIHFDHRGTGLSDPVPVEQLPDLHTQVDDAVAVLRAVGSEGAAVIGLTEGNIIAAMLAADHPELCRSLILHAFAPHQALAPELSLHSIDEVIAVIEASALTGDSGGGRPVATPLLDSALVGVYPSLLEGAG